MSWLEAFVGKNAGLYIDLGTANTLVVDSKKGLIANEPSVIAYRDLGRGRKSIIAVGNEAKAVIGKTPGNLVASYPLKDGVIADIDTTEAMLRYFLTRAGSKFQMVRPSVVISLPYGVSDVEKKAVKQAALSAGAREVVLIEEPMAAAIGAGLPVNAPRGNMVIDIGGGTTEVAIISVCGIVHCEAVRIGGYAFDQAIVDHLRRQINLVIGDQTAEKLKISIASAIPYETEVTAMVRGVDFITGLPKEAKVTSAQVHDAISSLLNEIIRAAKRALEQVPPDLVPDIIRDGIKLAGGGALLKGLDERLQDELGIPVTIADEPLLAIARGGEAVLKQPALLERIALH